jgi:hypothetical protein
MSYGSTHSATLPTVSSTVGPTYATLINAALTEIRTTLNSKVTPAGIDMNADLSLLSGGTRYGITNAHRVSLYQQPSLLSAATYPAALYVSSTGDLYFNDASSRQVRITSGGALTGTPGSITGTGYGSSGVEVNWDSGAGDYHFYSGSGTYADVNCTAVQLSDGSSNLLRIAAPAMAVNYTMTLPAAVPASTSIMQMSSAGVVSASPSGNIATTGTAATGALTVTGTASVSGLITATAGLTAASNQHVTVSGNGRFKHGSITRTLSATAGYPAGGSPTLSAGVWTAAGGTDVVDIPIPLQEGERLTGVWTSVNDAGGAAITVSINRMNMLTGASTNVGSSTSTGTGAQYVLVNGLTEDVTADTSYYVKWAAGQASDTVCGIYYMFTRP